MLRRNSNRWHPAFLFPNPDRHPVVKPLAFAARASGNVLPGRTGKFCVTAPRATAGDWPNACADSRRLPGL